MVVAWLEGSSEYQKKFFKVSYLLRLCSHITEFTMSVNFFFSRIKRNARDVLMGFGERE